MKCLKCTKEISSEMKGAIQTNTCPFCGKNIMDKQKAGQYILLFKELEKANFTSKESVDQKIREKVLNILLENFEFSKIENKNVINIDDDEVAEDEDCDDDVDNEGDDEEDEKLKDVPVRSLAIKKKLAKKEAKEDPFLKAFQEAHQEVNYDEDSDGDDNNSQQYDLEDTSDEAVRARVLAYEASRKAMRGSTGAKPKVMRKD